MFIETTHDVLHEYIHEKANEIKLYQVLKNEKHNYQRHLKTPSPETFHQYFITIGEKLAKNLNKLEPGKIEQIQPTMVLAFTNEHESKILENLKPKQSTRS